MEQSSKIYETTIKQIQTHRKQLNEIDDLWNEKIKEKKTEKANKKNEMKENTQKILRFTAKTGGCAENAAIVIKLCHKLQNNGFKTFETSERSLFFL